MFPVFPHFWLRLPMMLGALLFTQACAAQARPAEGATLPSYAFGIHPDQIMSDAQAGIFTETQCCQPYPLEVLIAIAAERSGLSPGEAVCEDGSYTTAPNAKSTVILAYAPDASIEGAQEADGYTSGFAQFRARVDTYMKGAAGAPGAAERHGGFITAIHPIAPDPRYGQSPPFLPAPLSALAARKERERVFGMATGAHGARRAPALPPDSVIVLFNDLQWGRMPAAMSVEQAIAFLEAGFSSQRHRFTREEADSETPHPCSPNTPKARSQP